MTRTTHTNLDVLQESRIDEKLEIRCGSKFIGVMDRIHEVHSIEGETSSSRKDVVWGEGAACKNSSNYPDRLWPDTESGTSRAAQLKEEQRWLSINRSSIMRGSSEASTLSIQMVESSRKPLKPHGKMKILIETTMPCKLKTTKCPNKLLETDSETKGSNKIQENKACMHVSQRLVKSTRKRLEQTPPKDHIAEKGFNSVSHYNLVHKFVLMLQAMKIPVAKAAVDTQWEKLEKLPGAAIDQSEKQTAQKRTKKNSPSCHADGHLSSQKVQRPGCAPR